MFWFVLIAATVLSGCLDTIEEIHVLGDGRFLFREIVVASRSEAVHDINERTGTQNLIPSDSELFAHENRLHAWSAATVMNIPDVSHLRVRDSLDDSLVFVISEAIASTDRAVERLHAMLFGYDPTLTDSAMPPNEFIGLRVRTANQRTTFEYTYNIMKDSVVSSSPRSGHAINAADSTIDEFLGGKDYAVVRIFGREPRIVSPATNARISGDHIEWRLPTVELTKFWMRKSNGATFEAGPSSNER